MYQFKDDLQDEPLETMHIYMYREPGRKLRPPDLRYTGQLAMQVCLLLISMVALLSLPADQPVATVHTVLVPLRFLPLTSFTASATITPTGKKVYPATTASGVLTVYNGSALAQRLPTGFILNASNGIEVITDSDVTIGPANPPQYGIATVSAHAAITGQAGNIPAYSVSAVYGADVYIKNLAPFSGGVDQKAVTYATKSDVQAATDMARDSLISQQYKHDGLLYGPCQERSQRVALMLHLIWNCQYVTYTRPRGQILSLRLSGRHIILRVRRNSGA